tara:strand:- start:1930 stop:2034 length:105 start_codon:yes stop_codon:yes gene_type:complete
MAIVYTKDIGKKYDSKVDANNNRRKFNQKKKKNK